MPDRKLKPSEVIYRYKEVEVGGSLKSHRIVLIFENIITQFRRAVLAVEQNDVPMRADAVSKSLKILGTLRQELDFGAAPELAANLDVFYLSATNKVFACHKDGDRDGFLELASEFHSVLEKIAQALSDQS
ncbi:MAG: flagellar protein FliS [Myxococcota bacterium]|nr:flagellar protein FliS [Myxococcota bacterium]